MFDKKSKTTPTVQYRVYTIGSKDPQEDLNHPVKDGWQFLDWLDDKWDRNGYSDFNGTRKAIYVK